MANPSQYRFELKEVAQWLLAKQGIEQGRWKIGVNFSIGAAEAGPTPEAVRPSIVISIDSILLTEASEQDAGPLVVEAKSTS